MKSMHVDIYYALFFIENMMIWSGVGILVVIIIIKRVTDTSTTLGTRLSVSL